MIFGFRRNRDEIDEEDDSEIDYVLFQGALNGKEPDLKTNARLVEAGMVPVKELVTDALERRAERIRLEPKGERAAVLLSVDGVSYPGRRMSKPQALAVTQMMKLLAGLDIRERTKPQSGGVKAELQDVKYELAVRSVPVPGGERLIVTIRDRRQKLDSPDDLGFTEAMRTKIRTMAAQKQGAILVCGPPFSGTTTTSFAVLRCVDAYLYSIFNIADLGGKELIHISTLEPNPGDDFTATMHRVIRNDAHVVFVDPIRTPERAREIFDLQDKVCIIAEFAAKDAAHGVGQLVQWVEDPKRVAQGLKAIVSQKLIRVLCKDCREAYRPNPKLIAKVGLPPETRVLYRPPRPPSAEDDPKAAAEYEPCGTCGGVGYFGRAGMYELLEMTEGLRELVARGAPPAELKSQARKEKMQSLQKEGLRLVAEGKTSLEELQRAFKPAQGS